MQDITIRPRINHWIGRGYALVTIFIAFLYSTILIVVDLRGSIFGVIILSVAMVLAVSLLAVTTYGFHKTAYTVRNGHLHAWSPFASIDLEVKDITKIEQTRVPFYFKGFGAGLYSGIFFIPGFGWTKVIMTNLTDGVLITTKGGKRFLITPSDPSGFASLIGVGGDVATICQSSCPPVRGKED